MNMSLHDHWGVGLAALLLSGVLAGCGEEERSDPLVPDANLPVASESGTPRAGGHEVRHHNQTESPNPRERSLQGSASKIAGDSLGRD